MGVRIDTHGGRFVQGLDTQESYAVLDRNIPNAIRGYRTEQELKYLMGTGVSAAAIWYMREQLNKAGFHKGKIIASSGFSPDKCRVFSLAKAPVDIIGTGSYLPSNWSDTYATADIISYNGLSQVKIGREFLFSRNKSASDKRREDMTSDNIKEMEKLSIALAQLNPHLGNVHLNTKKLISAHKKANKMGADIIITPEMFLAGYPCDDLVYRDDFIAEIEVSLNELAKLTNDGKPAIIVGAPRKNDGVLFNSLFVLDDGKIIHHYDKINLPNYGVFDEKRNFKSGYGAGPISLRGWRLGLSNLRGYLDPDIL